MADIQVQSGAAGTLLPASRQSPRAARVFVSERLREWHREAIAESAVLLVSELATNAVVHAQTPAQLEVRWFDHTVRVAVTDGMSDGVEPDDASLPAPIGAPAGRGLRIVEAWPTAGGSRSRARARRCGSSCACPIVTSAASSERATEGACAGAPPHPTRGTAPAPDRRAGWRSTTPSHPPGWDGGGGARRVGEVAARRR